MNDKLYIHINVSLHIWTTTMCIYIYHMISPYTPYTPYILTHILLGISTPLPEAVRRPRSRRPYVHHRRAKEANLLASFMWLVYG